MSAVFNSAWGRNLLIITLYVPHGRPCQISQNTFTGELKKVSHSKIWQWCIHLYHWVLHILLIKSLESMSLLINITDKSESELKRWKGKMKVNWTLQFLAPDNKYSIMTIHFLASAQIIHFPAPVRMILKLSSSWPSLDIFQHRK